MIWGADKVMCLIREAIHEGLVSFILQYIGTKEMINDMDSAVLSTCRLFHSEG